MIENTVSESVAAHKHSKGMKCNEQNEADKIFKIKQIKADSQTPSQTMLKMHGDPTVNDCNLHDTNYSSRWESWAVGMISTASDDVKQTVGQLNSAFTSRLFALHPRSPACTRKSLPCSGPINHAPCQAAAQINTITTPKTQIKANKNVEHKKYHISSVAAAPPPPTIQPGYTRSHSSCFLPCRHRRCIACQFALLWRLKLLCHRSLSTHALFRFPVFVVLAACLMCLYSIVV